MPLFLAIPEEAMRPKSATDFALSVVGARRGTALEMRHVGWVDRSYAVSFWEALAEIAQELGRVLLSGAAGAVDRTSGDGHEQGTTGGLQRWRDRHHHHHHGAGPEGAARGRSQRTAPPGPGVSELPAQLCLRRHLLEQSPPPAAGHPTRQ